MIRNETPPVLLQGRSALTWMKISAGALLGGLPSIVGIVLGATLPQPAKDVVLAFALAVGLALSGTTIWAAIRAMMRALDERDAGYTTLYGTLGELWQLDPRTGDVLRRPYEREVRRRPRDAP